MRRRAIPSTCSLSARDLEHAHTGRNGVVDAHDGPQQESGPSRVGLFPPRLAWMMAAFNLLARWSLEIDDENMGRLSIAEFGPNKLPVDYLY